MFDKLMQKNSFDEPWLLLIGGTLISAVALFLLKYLVFWMLRKWTKKTSFVFDSLFVNSLSTPFTLCTVMVLIIIFGHLLDETGFMAQHPLPISAIAKAICIVALILFFDQFSFGTIDYYSQKSSMVSNSRSIIKGLIRCTILCIGLLVLLGTLGISITPIIASLGITSLAVALALQPTLENFFSGVQLVIDKPIRVGDFIELDSKEQGFVEKITLEVAREILISHEWGVDDYNTFVVYHTFDQSSINFTVMLRAKEYFNRFWVKSAIIKDKATIM